LKNSLAVETLKKRAITARKAFEREYSDYRATVAYPVPTVAEQEDQDGLDVEEDIGQEENERMYTNVTSWS
jgi:hypothetical protein